MLNMPEKIKGKRIVLVRPYPVTVKLAEEVFAVREKSRETWEKWLKKMPKTSQEEYNLLSTSFKAYWESEKGFNYLIRDKKTQEILGIVCLDKVDSGNKVANIGYHLSDSAVGKGFASEAVVALEKVGFKKGFNRLELAIDPKNRKSIAVAERNGYRFEGCRRQCIWSSRDRKFHDRNMYSKLKSEWDKQPKSKGGKPCSRCREKS